MAQNAYIQYSVDGGLNWSTPTLQSVGANSFNVPEAVLLSIDGRVRMYVEEDSISGCTSNFYTVTLPELPPTIQSISITQGNNPTDVTAAIQGGQKNDGTPLTNTDIISVVFKYIKNGSTISTHTISGAVGATISSSDITNVLSNTGIQINSGTYNAFNYAHPSMASPIVANDAYEVQLDFTVNQDSSGNISEVSTGKSWFFKYTYENGAGSSIVPPFGTNETPAGRVETPTYSGSLSPTLEQAQSGDEVQFAFADTGNGAEQAQIYIDGVLTTLATTSFGGNGGANSFNELAAYINLAETSATDGLSLNETVAHRATSGSSILNNYDIDGNTPPVGAYHWETFVETGWTQADLGNIECFSTLGVGNPDYKVVWVRNLFSR